MKYELVKFLIIYQLILPTSLVNAQNTAGNQIGSTIIQMSQQIGQQIAQGAQQNPMQGELDAFNVSKQSTTPSKNGQFPEKDPVFKKCAIPITKSQIPENWCAAPHPSQLQFYNMKLQSAINNADFYDTATTLSVASQPMFGMECMENEARKIEQQLLAEKNVIQGQINLIKQQNEIFKRDAQKSFMDMQDIKALVDGGPTGSGKQIDYKSYFQDPACKATVSELTAQDSGAKGGLQSIQQTDMAPLVQGGKDLFSQAGSIERDVNSSIDLIAAEIQRNGIEQSGWDQASGVRKDFEEMKLLVDEEIAQTSKYIKDLAPLGLGYIPTTLDQNFDRNIQEAQNTATKRLKEDFYQSCVNQEFSTRLRTSVADLGAAIKQQGSGLGRTGTVFQKYLSDMNVILNSADLSWSDKVKAVAQLDEQNGNEMVASVNNGKYTPSRLLASYTKNCDSTFNRPVLDPVTKAMKSPAQSHAEAMNALQKARDKAASIKQRLSVKLKKELLTCEGKELSSPTTNECNPNSVKASESGFCLANAKVCANNFLQCSMKLGEVITQQRAMKKSKAETFNRNFDQLAAANQARVNDVANRFKQMATFLRSTVKSTTLEGSQDWTLPSELQLFQALPEKKLDPETGEVLAGGSKAGMESYISESALLKGMEAVEKKIDAEIARVKEVTKASIGELSAQYAAEKGKWEKIADECRGGVKAIQDQIGEGMKKQKEAAGKVGKFCREGNNATWGPGCGEEIEDLTTTFEEVVEIGALTEQQIDWHYKYRDMCNQFGGESDDGQDEESVEGADISDVCRGGEPRAFLIELAESLDISTSGQSDSKIASAIMPKIKSEKVYIRSFVEGYIKSSDKNSWCIKSDDHTSDNGTVTKGTYKDSDPAYTVAANFQKAKQSAINSTTIELNNPIDPKKLGQTDVPDCSAPDQTGRSLTLPGASGFSVNGTGTTTIGEHQ